MIAASSVSPKAPGAVASGANSRAISSNSPGRPESELEFAIGRSFAEFRGAFSMRRAIEQRVDEGRLLVAEEGMRDVDIFVDHHLGRHVGPRHQLEGRGTQ